MDTLMAGASHCDISPELGHNLAGWIDIRPATRQDTPILLRALALETNQLKVIIFTCDLVGVGSDVIERVERVMEELFQILPCNIFVLPSHNHYGPSVSGNYAGDADRSEQENVYTDTLVESFVHAARLALNGISPVELKSGFTTENTYIHNSRFWRKDGTINWVGERDTHFARESGPVDTQIGVLRFEDEQGKTIATLFNYACHANCAEPDGFSAISWDWPGYCAQEIEAAWGGEALFLPGACGNIHPIREGVAKEMGNAIADAILKSEVKTYPERPVTFQTISRQMELESRDFAIFDPHQIEVICSQLWDEPTQTRVQDIFMDVLERLKTSDRIPVKIRLRLLVLGDIAIIFIPGEYFTEFGLEIKRQSPFKVTFVVELLSESVGYIPTRAAYEEGGYQPAVGTRLAPGGGEKINDEVAKLLRYRIK